MIHYIDTSGSMTDDLLVQIVQIVIKRFSLGDKIFILSGSLEEIPKFFLAHLLLISNRFGRLDLIGNAAEIRKYAGTRVFYTDGVYPGLMNRIFDEIFVVPACPVCSCSCPDGVIPHINLSKDVLHNVWQVHNA